MKHCKRALCALLSALLVLAAAMLSAPRAYAAEYQDGDYTVSFSMEGLGRHNVAWDTATVHVKDGALYVDFTLERVDPRNHAPQYDWLKTSLGTYTPSINDAAFTCSFSWVQVPNLGRVKVEALTSSMSTPQTIEYTLVIGDSGIPLKEAPAPEPAPTPEPTPAPAPQPTQPTQPATPETPATPEPATETPATLEDPVTPEDPETAPAPETTGPADETPPEDVTGETPAPETKEAAGLGAGAIAAIVVAALVVIGVGAWLIIRKKSR